MNPAALKLTQIDPIHHSSFIIHHSESALQELDETGYWLELLAESGIINATRLDSLQNEANELTAILVVSVIKVKTR